MKKSKELKIGDKFSKSILVTDEMINGFAKYTGDNNPVQVNDQFASETIFRKRIAHGFLVGSLISAVLGNDLPDKVTINLSQTLKFKAPVFIDDEIIANVEVLDFTKEKRIRLKKTCTNKDGIVVLDGEPIIIPPQGVFLILN